MPDAQPTYVADRDANILKLMQRAHQLDTPADWLIYSQHNRCIQDCGEPWGDVPAGHALGDLELSIVSRCGQAVCTVRQQIRTHSITLPDGNRYCLSVTCLIAKEMDAPVGVEFVEWRSLANRRTAHFRALVELIEWYRRRWSIETFFHVLKNGGRVEFPQLCNAGKIELARRSIWSFCGNWSLWCRRARLSGP